MNELETSPDILGDNSLEGLRGEVQSLRMVVTGALLALIIVSGCLNVYLHRQASNATAELAQAQKYVEESNGIGNLCRDYWNKLVEFSKTHPDFKTNVIDKYSRFVAAASPPSPKK